MQLQLVFNTLDYVLMGALMVIFVYQVVFYSVYIAGVPRYLRRLKKTQKKLQSAGSETPAGTETPADNAAQPKGVSVIVCARNEEHNLRPYLQSLLTQDYPLYEVIVVNDGSEDGTREVIEDYMHRDPRIKMTFIPRNTTVMATKKLGITLGAKAAQYPYLLLTDADCRPESRSWITAMMSGFDREGIELVLGYGAYFSESTRLNRLINYDTLFNGLNYLGAALVHRPYMGVGRNLAYTRELFFRSGGFSDLMNNRSGDDDLFVNKVANRHNTAVVVVPESITWSITKQTVHAWIQQRRRHLSVSSQYSLSSRLHLGAEPLSRALFYGLIIAVLVLSLMGSMNILCAAAALLLFAARLILQISILDTAAFRMGVGKYDSIVIYYDIILPLVNLYVFATAPFHRVRRW